MKKFYLFCTSFFSILTVLYAVEAEKSDCLQREKALALLETAEDFLKKAEDSFPSCKKDSDSTNPLVCDGQKPLAFIEITKKLISDARENFPTCPKDVIQYVKCRDCAEISASGINKSGVYLIYPSESNATGKPLEVYCDMKTDDGGWTVIQRRGKFPVQQDFYQDWETYKQGFGNITEEFWLGNENIRLLCHRGCEIRFDIQDQNGSKGFAVYKNFNLTGSNYRLHISDYIGNVGDSLEIHNNREFSTKDKGSIQTVQKFHSGWWFGGSHMTCNLNGKYQPGLSNIQSVYWWHWRKTKNLASAEIKVRPM